MTSRWASLFEKDILDAARVGAGDLELVSMSSATGTDDVVGKSSRAGSWVEDMAEL